ncbi:sulfatase-like hydrolase/transferase [Pararhodonellum marinum]|uniref:sulfatase-like hydrolase/transferase n=1 Tax=Pararhodonellum marinum TaxID=2755358 RepID=UPI00189077EB|nr:sulfatase-like hydrolase/transferase [Pararhodonellum marinum]
MIHLEFCLSWANQVKIDPPPGSDGQKGDFFSNHYTGTKVCAPSRPAFMTGLHTGHTPVRGNFEVMPEAQYPMPDTLMTIPKLLKEAGYATGAFGKWGLGFNGTSGDPINQGSEKWACFI